MVKSSLSKWEELKASGQVLRIIHTALFDKSQLLKLQVSAYLNSNVLVKGDTCWHDLCLHTPQSCTYPLAINLSTLCTTEQGLDCAWTAVVIFILGSVFWESWSLNGSSIWHSDLQCSADLIFKYSCYHQVSEQMRTVECGRIIKSPWTPWVFLQLPWWTELDLRFPGCVICRGPLHSFIVWKWRPFEQSLPRSHWKEGRGVDEYFNSWHCVHLQSTGLTKMLWKQPKKYSSQPCDILRLI